MNAQNTEIKTWDIFETINGYDCTYYNFYQVVEVSKTGKTFKVRELKKARVATKYWYNTKPVKDEFENEEIHKVTFTKYGPRSGFWYSYTKTLYPWEGKEKQESEY